MKLIGLTGGIGTGKSSVAQVFRSLGWEVLSSDSTAKTVTGSNPGVRSAIAALLGEDVLTSDGLNSRLVAERVFGSDAESSTRLRELEKIIHPHVLEYHMKQIHELDERGSGTVVVDSALIYEVGLEDGFDYVVVVNASVQECIRRVMQRSGLTEEQVRQRIKQQMPMKEKCMRADFVIENSGTLDELEAAAKKLAAIIQALPDRQ